MFRKIWALVAVMMLGMTGTAAAQSCSLDVLYVVQAVAGKKENLMDKCLQFSILKGTEYPNPVLMVEMKPSAASDKFTERIWFEKGKCYYLRYKNEQGLSYLLYNTDLPNEGLNILVPSAASGANGMVQIVHAMNEEVFLDTAAFISREKALKLEKFILEQLENLEFDNRGWL